MPMPGRLPAEAVGGPEALRKLRDRHPAVLLAGREDTRSITLDKLIVPDGSRGRGLGSAVMRDLIAYADRHRKQVRLTPSGAYGGRPRRLAGVYARFGFVANADTLRDPACREGMYRDPA
jgi:GNAT superfamily N-acetyltransferase